MSKKQVWFVCLTFFLLVWGGCNSLYRLNGEDVRLVLDELNQKANQRHWFS